MPQHVPRSMLFNFYTGFGRFRRSAWSKKWYGSGCTSRIASDAPECIGPLGVVKGARKLRLILDLRQVNVCLKKYRFNRRTLELPPNFSGKEILS